MPSQKPTPPAVVRQRIDVDSLTNKARVAMAHRKGWVPEAPGGAGSDSHPRNGGGVANAPRTLPTMASRPYLNPRLVEFGTTIFAEMSELATRTGSINLGQGFPDFDG